MSLPDWIGYDSVPIGPNFIWAVRVKSSRPRDSAQPWFVVHYGIARSAAWSKNCATDECALLVDSVRRSLERLCWSDESDETPQWYSEEVEGRPSARWERSTAARADRGTGTVYIGDVEIFFERSLSALEFAEVALRKLLGHHCSVTETVQ